jgi:cyclase
MRLAGVLLCLAIGYVSYTQETKQPPRLKVNKVKDDLFEIEGDGGNVAVYITDEGVILIDDKYDQDYSQIMEDVRTLTSQPVKYVINTHYHADHSGGNAKFLPTAEIISTLNSRLNIVGNKQPNAPPGMVPARLTFTEEFDLFLGGKEVRARYFGRGHTNGDAVIYFPALRTIHTGDLMWGNTALIDYAAGGSLIEWTQTLDKIMQQLDFDTVIPGHGRVTTRAGLQAYRANIEKLRNRAQSVVREGKTQEELGKVMTAEFGWQPNSLNFQWSLPGMMTELK